MRNPQASSFDFVPDKHDEVQPARICVVGIGGGGGNALDNMITQGIDHVDFVAINTDVQALERSKATVKIQAGRSLTGGRGAGAQPEVGAAAMRECADEVYETLKGYDLVFITAGMGGGTGTGGAPIVAQLVREKRDARDMERIAVGVVTVPFSFEGQRRNHYAQEGVDLLRRSVDSMVVIPNERLVDISDANTTMIDSFRKADEVLYNATRGIADMATVAGLINVDLADVMTAMKNGGKTLMGSAVASGEGRAERAAHDAISSPLLDGITIAGAKNVILNVTASSRMLMREQHACANVISQAMGPQALLIWGVVMSEDMGDDVRVTVIATGMDDKLVAPSKPQRTVPIVDRSYSPQMGYKGTASLTQLDEPTFIRSEPRIRLNKSEEVGAECGGGDGAGKIRRVAANVLRERPERTSQEHADKPAFLRRMMD